MRSHPLSLCLVIAAIAPSAEADSLVTYESTWRYDTTTTDYGTSWRDPQFNDSAWPTGQGEFASVSYVDYRVLSRLSPGTSAFYFRQAFDVPDAAQVYSLHLRVESWDGMAVYINGTRGEAPFYSHRRWRQLPWAGYNAANGTTHPARTR